MSTLIRYVRRGVFGACVIVLVGCATSPPPAPAVPSASDVASIAALPTWLRGDFNNYLQTWQQKVDEVDLPHPNMEFSFQPLEGDLAGAILAVRRVIGQPESAVRRVLLVAPHVSQPRLMAYTLGEVAQGPLRRDQLQRDPICDVEWRQRDSAYQASSFDGDCPLTRDIKALTLTDTQLQATINGVEWVFKKARPFKGWMGVKRQQWDDTAADDDWVFMSDVVIHNEGQIVALVDKDDTPTGYAIQLERLVYQNTRTPVLKLGLIDQNTKKTITYTWSEPGSRLLGMNLRWFQAGLTALDE